VIEGRAVPIAEEKSAAGDATRWDGGREFEGEIDAGEERGEERGEGGRRVGEEVARPESGGDESTIAQCAVLEGGEETALRAKVTAEGRRQKQSLDGHDRGAKLGIAEEHQPQVIGEGGRHGDVVLEARGVGVDVALVVRVWRGSGDDGRRWRKVEKAPQGLLRGKEGEKQGDVKKEEARGGEKSAQGSRLGCSSCT